MAEILASDVTEGCLEGTGVFDEFQKAFTANIQNEYKHNRITGTEYSTTYLGGMQAAMQQAVVFTLGRQKADKEAEKIVKETELIQEKIVTEAKVRDKIDAEIKLINKTIEKMTFEILKAEVELWVTKAQISDDLTITTPPTNYVGDGVLGRQALKLASEVKLLDAKKRSEDAQTISGVAHSESVLGKEILLRQRQADGFLRDAEQKLASIVGDSYNVQFTTMDGPGDGQVPGNFTSGGVDRIINKAREGIGA